MAKRDREAYNEYMRVYLLRRYHERRTRALEILGGKCIVCQTTENLQIDHVDPSLKTYDLSRMMSGLNWNKVLAELEKCQALCATHHQEKSRAERSVPHGGGVSGKRNCPCDPCKERKAEYSRTWALRRAIQEVISEQLDGEQQ